MPYINSFKRDGIEQGAIKTIKESVLLLLGAKFKSISEIIKDKIDTMEDIDLLKTLLVDAIKVASVEDFEQLLRNKINAKKENQKMSYL